MNEFQEAAKRGGESMTVFGVIAIILGKLAMMKHRVPKVCGWTNHAPSGRAPH